jgi:hypothetical protein
MSDFRDIYRRKLMTPEEALRDLLRRSVVLWVSLPSNPRRL